MQFLEQQYMQMVNQDLMGKCPFYWHLIYLATQFEQMKLMQNPMMQNQAP